MCEIETCVTKLPHFKWHIGYLWLQFKKEDQIIITFCYLDDIYGGPPSRSKKSLDFSTPSTRQKSNQTNDPNDSFITPLEIDEDELNEELKSKTVKRKSDDLFTELSDDDTDKIQHHDLPSLGKIDKIHVKHWRSC